MDSLDVLSITIFWKNKNMAARLPLVREVLNQRHAGKQYIVFVSELGKQGMSLGARMGGGKWVISI